MSFVEYRDLEDNLLAESGIVLAQPYEGMKMTFDDVKYVVTDVILKNTKQSYWWSFGMRFDAFKMIVYLDIDD